MDGLPNVRDIPNGEEKVRNKAEEEEGLVSSLITKLEAVENGAELEQTSFHPNHLPEKLEDADQLAAIAKDLSRIKRQNTITHVLLGTVIVMTAVWQVNEASFLLWVQRKLSDPFKSLGDMIKASLKLDTRRPPVIESSPLPPVGIPDVTRADLPTLVISGDQR